MVESDNKLLNRLIGTEKKRVQEKMKIELDWWEGKTISGSEQAFKDGRLVSVPTEGPGFRLSQMIKEGSEYPLLNPAAYKILRMLGMRWRNQLSAFRIPNASFLSIVSLYRNKGEGVEIVSHQAGAAFDIDPNEYYLGNDGISNNDVLFDERYIDILIQVLSGMQYAGLCHVVLENKFDVIEGEIKIRNLGVHVCAAPDIVDL